MGSFEQVYAQLSYRGIGLSGYRVIELSGFRVIEKPIREGGTEGWLAGIKKSRAEALPFGDY